MRVSGIDTSTMTAALGLVEDDQVLVDLKFDVKATYSEILMPTVEEALKMVGLSVDDLDGLAISIGPGSFTGLRIGLSTVKGLCFATGKPLAAVPAWMPWPPNLSFADIRWCRFWMPRKTRSMPPFIIPAMENWKEKAIFGP